MLLAENLLLLVTDEASGRLRVPTDQLDPALAGANLVELTMMGRVDLSGEGSAASRAASWSVIPPRPVMKSSTRRCGSCWRVPGTSLPR